MTPRPPFAVAALILVCGLVPVAILFPYLWTGQWLKGLGVMVLQLAVAAAGLIGGVYLGFALDGSPGSAMPVLTMPLGCMAAAYMVSGIAAVLAYKEHRAAQAGHPTLA